MARMMLPIAHTTNDTNNNQSSHNTNHLTAANPANMKGTVVPWLRSSPSFIHTEIKKIRLLGDIAAVMGLCPWPNNQHGDRCQVPSSRSVLVPVTAKQYRIGFLDQDLGRKGSCVHCNWRHLPSSQSHQRTTGLAPHHQDLTIQYIYSTAGAI